MTADGRQRVRLGAVATVKARLGWKGLKAEEYEATGYHFLSTPTLKGHRIDFDKAQFIPAWRYEESPEIQLRVGDVLLVKDGSLGISNLVRTLPGPATLNGSIALVRCGERLDPLYLLQCVRGAAFQNLIRLKKAGLAVPHLFQADLREFHVELPPLPEQRQIAAVLDTIDDAIRKTEEIVAKLKQVKQGLLHDLLTRGIDDNGELRDPDRHPEQFKQSPLGRIPKKWEFTRLAAVADVRSGFAKNENQAIREPVEVHYLRVANVQDGFLDLRDLSKILIAKKDIERYRLISGDLLMNEGGDLDKLGRGTLWEGDVSPCIHQNHVFVVRCGPRVVPQFLDAWTGSGPARRYFMLAGKQTTNLASINKTALGQLPVVVPDRAEQQSTIQVLSEAARRLAAEQEESGKLKSLKAGLMEDLLTGRVRATSLLGAVAS